MKKKILVIRLGALGDLVLCAGAFAAIRAKHPDAEIALLTAPAFADFARQMPWFDQILFDPRPKFTDVGEWIKLIREVRAFAPNFVYDLQGKFRQTLLFYALGRPEWSGAAPGCSHPRPWPPKKGAHYTDLLAAQLKAADVFLNRSPDFSWLKGDLGVFSLPEKFAVFIPGCAAGRLYKRWPPEHYAALAKKLAAKGLKVFAVGTKQDQESIAEIRKSAPEIGDLSGRTSLGQLAELFRRAEIVVGNDTGPTHLAAAVGAKTIALMSDKVDPNWSAPRGPQTTWLQGKPLAALDVEEVYSAL